MNILFTLFVGQSMENKGSQQGVAMRKIPERTNAQNTTELPPKFTFERENIDKTVKEQKIWTSQPNSG